jgi:hypothetical protein
MRAPTAALRSVLGLDVGDDGLDDGAALHLAPYGGGDAPHLAATQTRNLWSGNHSLIDMLRRISVLVTILRRASVGCAVDLACVTTDSSPTLTLRSWRFAAIRSRRFLAKLCGRRVHRHSVGKAGSGAGPSGRRLCASEDCSWAKPTSSQEGEPLHSPWTDNGGSRKGSNVQLQSTLARQVANKECRKFVHQLG